MKTVLITGSSSGIGKAIARYFHQKGWQVAATMRNPEQEKELLNLENIKLYRLDVCDKSTIHETIRLVITDFGGINVLVNNAGYGLVGPFEASTEEQIQRQFDTNVFGLMNVTRAIIPHFRERKGGTIINITSVGGRMSFPLYGLYNSTKWAVEGFSESLQYELRPFGIKIRLIEPGAIKTDFYDRSMDVIKKKGLNVYDSYVHRVFNNIQDMGASAEGPEIVAKKTYKAAVNRGHRLRYSVGGGAPVLLFMKRILPERLFFMGIRTRVEKGRHS
ncbi:MAG: SDR family oxidoreductase [Bacteroidota bacterium]